MCGSSSVNLVNSSMSGSVCSKKKSSSSGSTHQHSDRGNGCTDTVQIGIGTLNVRSLWYGNKGPGALKLYHIICEMQHHCIDVMGVSETQWFGEGWFTVPYRGFDSYRVFHFGKRDNEKDKVKEGEPRKGKEKRKEGKGKGRDGREGERKEKDEKRCFLFQAEDGIRDVRT